MALVAARMATYSSRSDCGLNPSTSSARSARSASVWSGSTCHGDAGSYARDRAASYEVDVSDIQLYGRNLENEIYKRVAMHVAKLKRRLPPVLAAVWAERYCESEDDRPP